MEKLRHDLVDGSSRSDPKQENREVQEEAACQQVPYAQGPNVEIPTSEGETGPTPVLPSPSMGQMELGPHLMPMDQRTSQRYSRQQYLGLMQPNPQMMQQQEQQVVLVQSHPQQAIGGMGPSHLGSGPNIQTQQPGTSGNIGGAGGNAPGGSSAYKNALQQLLTMLKSPETPELQTQIYQILKSNPQLLSEFIKYKREFKLSQAQNQNQSNDVEALGGFMVPNQQPQDQLQHLMPQQQQQQQLGIMDVQAMPSQQGAIGPGVTSQGNQLSAGGNAPGGSAEYKLALQQLLTWLKLPNTPEVEAQIFQILNSYPHLTVEFIKFMQTFKLSQAWNQNQAKDVQAPERFMVPNQQPQHQLQHVMTQQQQQEERTDVQAMASQQAAVGQGVTLQGNQLSVGGNARRGNALQQMLTRLKLQYTPEQQVKILRTLKENPCMMAAYVERCQPFQLSENQIEANAFQEHGGFTVSNQQPRDLMQHMMTQQQQQQQQERTDVQATPSQQAAVGQGVTVQGDQLSAGENALHKKALHQLLTKLSQYTREQQVQVLQILKENPRMMAAFIKSCQPVQLSQNQNKANAFQEHGRFMVPNQQPRGLMQTMITDQLHQLLQRERRMDVLAMLSQRVAAGPGGSPQESQTTPQESQMTPQEELRHLEETLETLMAMRHQKQEEQ